MTDPEIAVYAALWRWRHQHPDHPGPSELALYAITGLGEQQIRSALRRLEADGHARMVRDRANPDIRRWQLTSDTRPVDNPDPHLRT